ncbi:MAG TPA: deoxyribose-phosphate aldolase [Candidatus Marinimicrobia bacterium]|nr:deoxyribose-phosphate aldolase [Candidatus Neomarinimicrobiota bacterium]
MSQKAVKLKNLTERREISRMIDHTLLRPDTKYADLDRLCDEAKSYEFYSVCVNSSNVAYCAKALYGSRIAVASVIGFPLGAQSTEIKAHEAAKAIAEGAGELDMVINIGWLKSEMWQAVYKDILAVVRAAHGLPVKVILETGLLTDEEKIKACLLAKDARAAYVKTSTGFGQGGATVEDIKLMRRTVGSGMGVKASGGIRSLEDLMKMKEAGANRIGTSNGVAIVTDALASREY